MIDADSFGTALSILAAIAAVTAVFGLAILSDTAMRRREDRAARQHATDRHGQREEPGTPEAAGHRGRANGRVPTG